MSWAFAFVVGVAISELGERLGHRLGGRSRATWFAAATVLFFGARPIAGETPHLVPVVECLGAAGIITILAFCCGTGFPRSLDHRVLRFYGRLSFSCYLLHPLTLPIVWTMPDQIGALLARGVPASLVAFATAVASFLAITPLAWLTWRFVELPGVSLGKKVVARNAIHRARNRLIRSA